MKYEISHPPPAFLPPSSANLTKWSKTQTIPHPLTTSRLPTLFFVKEKVCSKCHAQVDELHVKKSTETICNVLPCQIHFVSSLLYIVCISLFMFHTTAVKCCSKMELTIFPGRCYVTSTS